MWTGLKEDRKKDEVGTMTRRVESMEGICYKCNNKGHFARDCSAKVRCETCSSDRHVTALHRDDPRSPRSRSRDESIRDGSRSRESSLSHRVTARSGRTPKSESRRSKSPRRDRESSKNRTPRRSKSREEEAVDTTRRMITGTADGGGRMTTNHLE